MYIASWHNYTYIAGADIPILLSMTSSAIAIVFTGMIAIIMTVAKFNYCSTLPIIFYFASTFTY